MGNKLSLAKKREKKESSSSMPRLFKGKRDGASQASTEISHGSSSDTKDVIHLVRHEPVEQQAPMTPNVQLITDWVNAFDEHNLEKVKERTKEDCTVDFAESEMNMLASDFFAATAMLYASFPDLHFTWSSIEACGPDRVIVKTYQASGHHTGAPFGFEPFDPIAPKGTFVEDEPMELNLLIQDGKVAHCITKAFGALVGPPGYYVKLGGVLF